MTETSRASGIVTRTHIDRLRSERATPEQSLDLTPGGATEAGVHSQIEAGKEAEIASGELSLEEAAHALEHDYAFSSIEGQAQVDFNAATEVEAVETIEIEASYIHVEFEAAASEIEADR